jgi:cell wall-associated NlpC family hydrolase
LRTLHLGARAFIPVALAGAVLFSLAPSTPATATTATEAQQIVRIARAQIGDHWRYGAAGPRAFDCSGLVLYAFRHAGDARAIHTGYLRSARAIYRWFKAHGRASRINPRIGDLVVWGGGTHIGIYIGRGKAISTLRNGVHIHGVHAVTARFTAYLHTGMSTRPVR